MVIGGGVAGAAAAIRFRHHGFEVHLAERAEFPREKVCGCCLGAAGLAALDAIGLGETVRQLGVRLDRFEGFFDDTVTSPSTKADPSTNTDASTNTERAGGQSGDGVEIPIVPGVAISRSVLDSVLLQTARQEGVQVAQPAEARIETAQHGARESVWVQCRKLGERRRAEAEPYDLVVIATGLSGRFETGIGKSCSGGPILPWEQTPTGPMGVAVHLPGDKPWSQRWRIKPGAIQMICDDLGYLGIVRLPNGGLDLAAAIDLQRQREMFREMTSEGAEAERSVRSSAGPPWLDWLLKAIRRADVLPADQVANESPLVSWCRYQAVWMATPPLRRARCEGRGRVVAIGDAMRYVEPLTGEGMTWGIESGLAVADCWAQWCATAKNRVGASTRQDFGSQWARHARRLQSRRRRTCDWVTRSLRHRPVRLAVQYALRRAPWLSRPITGGLARGVPFAVTYGAGTAASSNQN